MFLGPFLDIRLLMYNIQNKMKFYSDHGSTLIMECIPL